MKDYKEIADKAREILFVEIDGLEDLHICLLDEYKRKNALSTIVEYCLEKNHNNLRDIDENLPSFIGIDKRDILIQLGEFYDSIDSNVWDAIYKKWQDKNDDDRIADRKEKAKSEINNLLGNYEKANIGERRKTWRERENELKQGDLFAESVAYKEEGITIPEVVENVVDEEVAYVERKPIERNIDEVGFVERKSGRIADTSTDVESNNIEQPKEEIEVGNVSVEEPIVESENVANEIVEQEKVENENVSNVEPQIQEVESRPIVNESIQQNIQLPTRESTINNVRVPYNADRRVIVGGTFLNNVNEVGGDNVINGGGEINVMPISQPQTIKQGESVTNEHSQTINNNTQTNTTNNSSTNATYNINVLNSVYNNGGIDGKPQSANNKYH